MSVLAYEDLREARRQILAIENPEAQDALFTVLGLLSQFAEALGDTETSREHTR